MFFSIKTKIFYVVAIKVVKIFPSEVVTEYYIKGIPKSQTKDNESKPLKGRFPSYWKNLKTLGKKYGSQKKSKEKSASTLSKILSGKY